MRIGFDVSQTGKGKAGCGYFADGLIRQLASSDSKNEYILYPAMGDLFWDPECAIATFTCARPNFRRLDSPSDFEAARGFWRDPGLDFEQRLGSPDVIHSNNFYCPRGLKKARLVYTLYDLSFTQEPAWTTEPNRIGCFQGIFEASLRADWIVAISEHTRWHFLSMFPKFPAERVSVIYPASRFERDIGTERPARFGNLESGKFWLSVGTIEPRKNHGRLIDAYRIVRNECGSAFPLVLAGGTGWLMDHFEAMMRDLQPNRDVFLPGYVADSELNWLFRNCFGFVYPSLFEGFGMPVLEALGFGAAVLCSNATSLPEITGESAAVLFDPLDPRAIADAMMRLIRGTVNRDSLQTAALERAKRFSWKVSAAQLCEVYECLEDMRSLPDSLVALAASGV